MSYELFTYRRQISKILLCFDQLRLQFFLFNSFDKMGQANVEASFITFGIVEPHKFQKYGIRQKLLVLFKKRGSCLVHQFYGLSVRIEMLKSVNKCVDAIDLSGDGFSKVVSG